MAVCAVAITASVVWRTFTPAGGAVVEAGTTRAAPRLEESVWHEVMAAGTRIHGSDSARVSIAVFTDFECPACRALHEQMHPVLEEYGEQLEVRIVHFPLSIHRHARSAAAAFECVAESSRIMLWVDSVFAAQDSLGTIGWGELARRAGMADTASAAACVADPTMMVKVDQGRSLARRLRLPGTPTVFINTWGFGGVPNEADIRARVQSMLE